MSGLDATRAGGKAWTPFLAGAVVGCVLTVAWTRFPLEPGERELVNGSSVTDSISERSSGSGGDGTTVPLAKKVGAPLKGEAAFLVTVDGRTRSCTAPAEGHLRPKDGYALLEARLATKDLDCGDGERAASRFVRDELFLSDHYPEVSLLVLVGDIDRSTVVHVDQLALQGRPRLIEDVKVVEHPEGLDVEIGFGLRLLSWRTSRLDDVEVSQHLTLELRLRRVEETSDE